MKRIFRRVRLFLVAGLCVAFVVSLAYSAGLLTISNTLNVSTPAVNLFAQVTTLATCPAPPTGYTDTALTMSWSVSQGGTQTQNVCVYNSGTAASHVLTVTFNPGSSTGITMSFTPNPATLTGNTPLLVAITLTASSTATGGSGSTTNIS